MKTYLEKTKYNTYRYVRRVPKELLEYTATSRFRASLGSNLLEATQSAVAYNYAIEEALQLLTLNLDKELILAKLQGLIAEEKAPVEEHESGSFSSIVNQYLSSQKSNISVDEIRDKSYFYKQVAPTIFKHIGLSKDPIVTKISYNHLLEYRSIVLQLPKRNIQYYRDMDIVKVLSSLDQVQESDRISARTANKYLKWLRALFNFAVTLQQLNVNLANSLPLLKTVDEKLQRLPLQQKEFNQLLQHIPSHMLYLLKVLAYTGMRLSELYKCSVEIIEGIECFSLLDRSVKLKTKSSYRVIPVHSSLLEEVEHFYSCREAVTSHNLARTTSKLIKRLEFADAKKKSLYSLRHSFATELIQKGADPTIVSELMGHTHSTMTLSRYSIGFSVRQLRDVIELL